MWLLRRLFGHESFETAAGTAARTAMMRTAMTSYWWYGWAHTRARLARAYPVLHAFLTERLPRGADDWALRVLLERDRRGYSYSVEQPDSPATFNTHLDAWLWEVMVDDKLERSDVHAKLRDAFDDAFTEAGYEYVRFHRDLLS